MDDFIVVYIFRESANAIFGEDIFRLLIGCIALIIGIVLFKQAKDEQSKPMAMFRAVFVLFWAFVWISIHGLILVSQINEYSKVVRIYKNHTYSLAEGTVEVVHQEPAGGHDKGDIILVDGKRFEFSYYAHSFYYHQTISHGGSLKDGVYARLTYYENPSALETNPIIRVEVLETEVE